MLVGGITDYGNQFLRANDRQVEGPPSAKRTPVDAVWSQDSVLRRQPVHSVRAILEARGPVPDWRWETRGQPGRDTATLDVKGLMQQVGQPCKYRTWRWVDKVSGESSPMCCGNWNCGDCRKRMAAKWAHKALTGEPNQLITITMVPEDKKERRHKWQQFMRALKHGYGKRPETRQKMVSTMRWIVDLMSRTRPHLAVAYRTAETRILSQAISGFSVEYARFLETGSRSGMRHYHLLVRCPTAIPHLIVVSLAYLFGFGHVGDVREIYNEGGVWYAAKYLGKSGRDSEERKVTCSRGFLPRRTREPGINRWVLYNGQGIRVVDTLRGPVDRYGEYCAAVGTPGTIENQVPEGYDVLKHVSLYRKISWELSNAS